MAAVEAIYTSNVWRTRIRPQVLARDGYVCQIKSLRCTVEATEVDHIVAVVDGGDWYNLNNLRAACKQCNAGRGNGVRRGVGKPSREW